MESLELSTYWIMLSTSRTFAMWCHFLFFPLDCSGVDLWEYISRNGANALPCLVPDRTSFLPSVLVFVVLRCTPFVSAHWGFLAMRLCWFLLNSFSTYLEAFMLFLPFVVGFDVCVVLG